MTNAEKITAELKKCPLTAKALSKRLGIGKVYCFRILHRIAKKSGKVREGRTGPLATTWVLR